MSPDARDMLSRTIVHGSLLNSSSCITGSKVIGALFSSVTQPLAGLTGAYEVPQISYGATAAALSDSSLYPFFLRTVASDNIQAQAWWAWFQAFEVPAVAMVYTNEAYGSGLRG
eukprot:6481638-Amphidinium_carterae.2